MGLDQRGFAKGSLAVVLLLGVAIVFTSMGFLFRTTLQAYQPNNRSVVLVEVERGQSPLALSQQLETLQVVRNRTLFYYFGKIRGSWGKIKAGEYELSPSMTPSQILDVLCSGISVSRPFLVREGENSYEIATSLEAKGWGSAENYIKLIRDPNFIATVGLNPAPSSLEGYLFPDTYLFSKKTTPEEILRTMVKRFLSAWSSQEEQRAVALGMTRDQVITLASVVEKETGAPAERPLISGVFHNRLKKKMKLQSDPTSIYGIWQRYDGNLRKKDLLDPNPYNTYYVPGLPVGPISNPGLEAIRATLSPAEHTYLYFVSKNDGTHTFTSTYSDHEKAVAQYQLDRKAREGKSWRDLGKTKEPSVISPK